MVSSRVESEGGAQPRLETQHATRLGTPQPVDQATSRQRRRAFATSSTTVWPAMIIVSAPFVEYVARFRNAQE